METPSLKKNLPLLITLTLSGSFICSLPWFRSYYYNPFMETFGMTNTQMGLCGTALGVGGIAAYLFGGIICDYISIKKLIPAAMISTGALGLVMLTIPSPIIMVIIHGLFAITCLMLFFPAQTKAVRNLASVNEQGKAFGIFEGGRGISNTVYLAIAALIFGQMTIIKSESFGVRGIILFYSVMTILLGVIDIVLLKGIDDGKKGDSNDTVNLKMLTKPLKMPAVWLMIGIIFATLTISTGYYYISPYVTEVFGVSALLGAVLSSSSQYIRPIASFGAGVLGDRINNSKVMLIGQIGLAIALVIILAVPSSMGVLPILVACLMIFFCMYMCVTMHFAIMDEEYFPPECVGTAIGLICAIGYLPEKKSIRFRCFMLFLYFILCCFCLFFCFSTLHLLSHMFSGCISSATNLTVQAADCMHCFFQRFHMFFRRRFNISHGIRSPQSFIFILSKSVIWKQMDLIYSGKSIRKPCNPLDFFNCIIKRRYHRHADYQICLS